MLSREQRRANLHAKLQLLRSVTRSHAVKKTSMIADASKYIEELKQKVERLNREIAFTAAQSITVQKMTSSSPAVSVEGVQKVLSIKVYSSDDEKIRWCCCPGLLVCVMETFEELGLNVMEARASNCIHTFRLQPLEEDHQFENVDAQMVRQAVLRAINNCARHQQE